MTRRRAPFALLSFIAAATLVATRAQAGTVTTETQGARSVRVFTPTKPASPLPMVVMLHGCTQDPNGFADATGMDAVAEENGFVVVYPEQPASVTPTKCWQWWETANQARDAGEPKQLADAISAIAAAKGVDAQRVYVAGLSAGGAMTTILGATYPDRVAAIGVVAGLEYKATTSFGGVLEASSKGGPDPNVQADAAIAAMGVGARAMPAIVFQGTNDSVVAKVNGEQVAAMWLGVAARALGAGAIDSPTPTSVTDGYPFTWSPHVVKAKAGASVVELYMIDGLGHAWPGGKAGGSYSDPKGPKASRALWKFFAGRTVAAPLDVAPPTPPAPGSSSSSSSSGGSTSGGSSSGGSSGSNEAPAPNTDDAPASTSDSGGCGVAARSNSGAGGLSALCLLALLAWRRRERTREQSTAMEFRACSCTSRRGARRTRR
ncbi:MAG: PHB depolymerase family esterase [Deltaproteobacteria bacterium]|nr:PHB depolymerase family esterase [Deltaproteobacteria bacterium]